MVITAARFFARRARLDDELAFWDGIRLPNGTWKTTTRHRFDDLNALVIAQWRESGFAPKRVLDVAASSGITSLEWLEAMRGAGFDPQMTATDLVLDAVLLQYLPFYRVLVLDTPERQPLQHDLFGLAVYPFLQWSGTLPLRLLAMGLHAAARRRTPTSERKVKLVSPQVAEQITFVQDDLFDASTKPRLGHFDVVRACNVLNRDYFPEAKIRQALNIIRGLLSGPGAQLIIARTLPDGGNHGTLFRLREDGRFESIVTIGKGSEIAELVAS